MEYAALFLFTLYVKQAVAFFSSHVSHIVSCTKLALSWWIIWEAWTRCERILTYYLVISQDRWEGQLNRGLREGMGSDKKVAIWHAKEGSSISVTHVWCVLHRVFQIRKHINLIYLCFFLFVSFIFILMSSRDPYDPNSPRRHRRQESATYFHSSDPYRAVRKSSTPGTLSTT